jgi:hypothetical protein
MLKRKLLSEDGVSILQVLMVAGVVSVISLGVVNIMKLSTKVAKRSSEDFEIERAQYFIESLFRDSKTCRSTLFNKNPTLEDGDNVNEIINLTGIEDVKVYIDKNDPPDDTDDIDAHENTEYEDLYNDPNKKKVLLKLDCPKTGKLEDLKPCTWGTGTSSRIFFTDMRVVAYGNSNAPYFNAPDQASLEYTIIRGGLIGKSFMDANEKSLTQKEKEQRLRAQQQSLGAAKIKRRIQLSLSLDSNKKITNCVTELKDYFDEACEDLLQGKIDKSGNLKCKNVFLFPRNESPENPAITSNGKMEIQGSLFNKKFTNPTEEPLQKYTSAADTNGVFNLGDLPGGTTNNGSMNISGHAIFKSDVNILSGNLLFGGLTNNEKAQLKRTSDRELTLSSKTSPSLDYGVLKLGSTTRIIGKNSFLGINTSGDPDAHLNVEGDTHFNGNLIVDGEGYTKTSLKFYNDDETKINTITSSGGNIDMEGSVVKIIGQNRTPLSGNDNYVATRGWVYDLFSSRLGGDAVEGVIDNILEDSHSGTPLGKLSQSFADALSPNSVSNPPKMKPSGACNFPQAARGFTSSGAISCTQIIQANTSCSNGFVAHGINPDGTVKCVSFDNSGMTNAIRSLNW